MNIPSKILLTELFKVRIIAQKVNEILDYLRSTAIRSSNTVRVQHLPAGITLEVDKTAPVSAGSAESAGQTVESHPFKVAITAQSSSSVSVKIDTAGAQVFAGLSEVTVDGLDDTYTFTGTGNTSHMIYLHLRAEPNTDGWADITGSILTTTGDTVNNTTSAEYNVPIAVVKRTADGIKVRQYQVGAVNVAGRIV